VIFHSGGEALLILLASSSQDDLSRWERDVDGLAPVTLSTDLAMLSDQLVRVKPQIILLDHHFPGLHGSEGIAALMRLSPETKFIILSRSVTDEIEWELFRIGVRGCCKGDMAPGLLRSVVEAVGKGELWIRRSLSWRLLNELVSMTREQNQIKRVVGELLSNLTRREYEIATLVGNGESNKQIARRLSITERTVKAHLTEVFRKLEVADRLKLALIVKGSVSSTNLSQTEH
jgi:DNA-binding NarL/FixJ family response regulator